jgi:hypothetical protein
MNLKTTLGLLAALAALCLAYGFMVWFEQRTQVRQAEAKRVFSFEPEAIASVNVQRIDEAPAAAAREPGQPWKITKPNPTIEANQVVWDRLAKALAGLTNERTIETSPVDLTKYGLDKPVLTIGAVTTDGLQVLLNFGVAEPTQTCRYVAGQDNVVFLAPNKAFQEMDRPLSLLRVPYVVTVGKEGITRLEYARIWTGRKEENPESKPQTHTPEVGEESVTVAVEKSPDGKWQMVSPIQALANQEAVESLIKEVQFGVGRDYIEQPEDLSYYGLNPANARITIYSGVGSEPQTLLLGSLQSPSRKPGQDANKKAEGGVFAKQASRPAVFVMDANVLALLPKTPDGFREGHLLTRPATDLQSIHYVTPDTDIVLENDPERGWRLTGPEEKNSDQLAVANFVLLLKALQGRGFPGDPRPEFGLDNPRISMALTFKSDPQPLSIRVGASVPDTEQYYATQDHGVVTVLNSLDVAALTKTVFDFMKRWLMRFEKDEAIQLTLEFEGRKYVFEKIKGQWHLKEPVGRTLGSPRDVEALIEPWSALSAIAVEREMIPSDLSTLGLDKPLVTIAVTTSKRAGATPETSLGPVTIGNPVPNRWQRRYAITANDQAVYSIEQKVVDEIRETIRGIN